MTEIYVGKHGYNYKLGTTPAVEIIIKNSLFVVTNKYCALNYIIGRDSISLILLDVGTCSCSGRNNVILIIISRQFDIYSPVISNI